MRAFWYQVAVWRLCALVIPLLPSLAWPDGFGGEATLRWPPVSREARPHTYWWWMGSAVDTTNITLQLEEFRAAGFGGVHIIPIYGAKGWEDRYLSYLGPEWMQMLRHVTEEAKRLDLNVDMTTGSGWCFGGPRVTPMEANAVVICRTNQVEAGGRLAARYDRDTIQALAAFGPNGSYQDLRGRIGSDGQVDWRPADGPWQVYAVSQEPSRMRVKRASPGGTGFMLNLFYSEAMKNYLAWFDEGFASYRGPMPRAMYHDSYEYVSNWSPDLLSAFAVRRGYRLESELPALFGTEGDHAARVKCDYRETLSDLMVEETLPLWVEWSRRKGMITRNEAHGSPGNLLDMYALSEIPETEMFHKDRNRLVSKFASSAAHVTGRKLVAAETGTWLKEHFTETLADMKYLLDDLFLSGVNHIFYHGSCYSPAEVPWPGWLFYASFQMNSRNPVWYDVPALNTYASRCQSVLQQGQPDNDILLYWPIHDFWHSNDRLEQKLTVHARGWLEQQSIGNAAELLWSKGYAFDYISDRQLHSARARAGQLELPGGCYAAIVVPACERMPLPSLQQILDLARSGATVVFERQMPADVPGWGMLDERRSALTALVQKVKLRPHKKAGLHARVGRGRVFVGELRPSLEAAGIRREAMTDQPGINFIRRRSSTGVDYFVANRGETLFRGTLPVATRGKSIVIMDPMTGANAMGKVSKLGAGQGVELALEPGESVILRVSASEKLKAPEWRILKPAGEGVEIVGPWDLAFLQGGPELPSLTHVSQLVSWTELGAAAQAFGGTARYTTTFDLPAGELLDYWLDLGKVCQSARVSLNGKKLAILINPPYRVKLDWLQPAKNRLEVEVTNTAANRIRDLDRRGVAWRVFHDINFVNIDYKPFDASNWPLHESGLLGPVKLIPLKAE